MTDARILSLLWQRSERASEVLAIRFGRRLYSTALNILQDPQDAEEAVNDTYFAVWNTIPPNRPTIYWKIRPRAQVCTPIQFSHWPPPFYSRPTGKISSGRKTRRHLCSTPQLRISLQNL